MPESCSLFKSSSHRQKTGEKTKTHMKKSWRATCTRTCSIFIMFSILLSLCGTVSGDSFPPEPSQHIIIEETCVSVSLTTPANTAFINVTEHDAKQIVKNVTVEFHEPSTYVSFTLQVLSKRPSYVGPLDNSTLLKYYAIMFSTGVTNETANVKMDFAIEKDAEQENCADEKTLVLYRYDGEEMQECPTEKVGEDDEFLYFRTNTEGASYVAVTGGVNSSPWWLAVVILAAVALTTVIGIYGYRKSKLAKLRKILRTVYGK